MPRHGPLVNFSPHNLREGLHALVALRMHPRPIRMRLSADSPVAMDNFDTDLTFFEPYQAEAP